MDHLYHFPCMSQYKDTMSFRVLGRVQARVTPSGWCPMCQRLSCSSSTAQMTRTKFAEVGVRQVTDLSGQPRVGPFWPSADASDLSAVAHNERVEGLFRGHVMKYHPKVA